MDARNLKPNDVFIAKDDLRGINSFLAREFLPDLFIFEKYKKDDRTIVAELHPGKKSFYYWFSIEFYKTNWDIFLKNSSELLINQEIPSEMIRKTITYIFATDQLKNGND